MKTKRTQSLKFRLMLYFLLFDAENDEAAAAARAMMGRMVDLLGKNGGAK